MTLRCEVVAYFPERRFAAKPDGQAAVRAIPSGENGPPPTRQRLRPTGRERPVNRGRDAEDERKDRIVETDAAFMVEAPRGATTCQEIARL